TSRNELPGDFITHLFEDSRGDIWIATHPHTDMIVRWERATEKFHRYSQRDGLPSDREGPMDFCEDRAGNLWIGYKGGGIVRLSEGRSRLFTTSDGIGAGSIRDLFVDREGRLWIASSAGGLCRTDDPTKDQPQFITITERDGLSSNETWCVVADEQDRIYAGTALGLDRIDRSGIRHYTTADGLANQTVEAAFRDRRGALWFATTTGISRLVPEPDVTRAQPDMFISEVRVNGNRLSIAGLGQSEIAGFEFDPAQNNIQIEFFGISFSSTLKYQYKFEGAGADWSAPSEDRSINLASLQPGSYRFLVRAVNPDGAMSEIPASVSFTILRPVWQRWWFLTPAVTLAALLVYGAYRYRVAQLIRIERVRTRIATDLHDDIGSNLSVIRGMSDLLRHQMKDADRSVADRLEMIAEVSSRSVEAMSDIIWAVNPSRDNAHDLAQRMRRFASDAFTSRNIEVAFDAPDSEHNAKIDTEARREVYLIFKEAVNNAVRHAGCSRAEIVMRTDSNRIFLKVSDDGKGFDPDSAEMGNGVMSMRRRAEKIDGSIEIESKAGEGTTVILKAPLRRRSP
ncbi:MAG TPA: two-component regulator propeller domain-containing protein, partial [Blastocatellia bacterium]